MSTSAIITVALCTYNRYELLSSAINSVLCQTLDRSLYEVLVVDNSTDRAAAETFYDGCSFRDSIRIVWSSPPGLSRARNVAIEQTETPYVAFVDDDAIADPEWLSGLLDGFGWDPKIAVTGGPIWPLWPGERPLWLPEEYLGLLTILDRGTADRTLEAHEHVFGANMAFAVDPLRACGGFPEQVGRTGSGTLLSREELEVQDALKDRGYLIRYMHRAGVRHLIHEDRLRRNWMRSRMAWESASEQLQEPSPFSNEQAVHRITHYARMDPDVRAAVRLFFDRAEQGALTKQLEVVRDFTGLLLGAHHVADSELEAAFSELRARDEQDRRIRESVMRENDLLRNQVSELDRLRSDNTELAAAVEHYKALAEENSRKLAEHTESTSWKVTAPIRQWTSERPRLRHWLRRLVYLGWQTFRGDLFRTIKERRERHRAPPGQ